jgi:serine/threonine-protein kinase
MTMATAVDVAIPTTIGKYQIEGVLGRGGMAVVYHGVHEDTGEPAAIKFLLAAVSEREDLVQRFFIEAHAATSIRHRGIIEVRDFGIDRGRAYIVMEYLRGCSLAKRLRTHGQLAIPAAIEIARQIAEALAAAHATGIVHRDLKPDNVFLVPEANGERVVLLDFGVAKLLEDPDPNFLTITGAILGTPQYMSPEQCEGASAVDHRSDLYSLGCTLFHMLTGRLVFEHPGVGGQIGAHLHVKPPRVRERCPAASLALDTIVDQLLSKCPKLRFQSANDVVAALSRPEVAIVTRPFEPATSFVDSPGDTRVSGMLAAIDPPRSGRWKILASAAFFVGVIALALAARSPTKTSQADPRLDDRAEQITSSYLEGEHARAVMTCQQTPPPGALGTCILSACKVERHDLAQAWIESAQGADRQIASEALAECMAAGLDPLVGRIKR